jgi:hypothetical protein
MGGDGHIFNAHSERKKSSIQKLRERNKQVNYYMTKFGLWHQNTPQTLRITTTPTITKHINIQHILFLFVLW